MKNLNPGKQTWPPSSIVLALSGLAVIGIGLFFILLRPPLLPEDTRYIGISLEQLQATQPRLASWLLQVFRVLGGYALATGMLTVALALTSFRQHQKAAGVGALLAGAVSIGWMAVVNFMINSDFQVGAAWCRAPVASQPRTVLVRDSTFSQPAARAAR